MLGDNTRINQEVFVLSLLPATFIGQLLHIRMNIKSEFEGSYLIGICVYDDTELLHAPPSPLKKLNFVGKVVFLFVGFYIFMGHVIVYYIKTYSR